MALTDSLVSYWKCDEGTGTVVGDSVASNTGTPTGTVWGPGKIGGGLVASGGTNYVSVGNHASLQLTTVSVACWAKPNALNGTIVSKWVLGAGGYEILLGGSGEIYCRTSDNSTWYDSYAQLGTFVIDGLWHHFAITVTNGSTGKVYLDGYNRTTTTVAHTITTNTTQLRFGTRGDVGGEHFDGKIDEIGIWSREITAAEVRELYKGGTGLPYPFTAGSGDYIKTNFQTPIRPRLFAPGNAR